MRAVDAAEPLPDHRSGFQQLMTEVSLNHVGIVLGLELSRLSRSNKDWHQLIDVCAIFDTLLGACVGWDDLPPLAFRSRSPSIRTLGRGLAPLNGLMHQSSRAWKSGC